MRNLGLMVVAALALGACGKSETGEPAKPAAPPLSAAEQTALVATLPAPYNTGDIAKGEEVFALCKSCHTLIEGGASMTGPNLHGLFGRKAASDPNYNYSDALKAVTFSWDAANLDKWLLSPKDDVPGTRMTFPGLKDPQDRINVIAYIKAQTTARPAG